MAGHVKKPAGKSGAGCLTLFGLPFAAVGVGMAWFTLSTVMAWHAMQEWEEVPARIEHAELEEHHGDDSTTYSVDARYTYEYGGQQYTGTRVAIGHGSDNVTSFHQDAYDELAQYRESGQPFRCFVNPRDPSESILYRDLRWEMLLFYSAFVVTFGGAGVGLVGAGIWGVRKTREENQLRAQYPDQPWQWNREWASGEIRSSTKANVLAGAAFTVFWNAIAFPLGYFIVSEAVLREGQRLALLVLLFPAIGAVLILWTVRGMLQWRKFGSSMFRMAEVPGVIGGKLSGVIDVPVKVRPEDGFHLTLSCVNRVTTGSGKHRSTTERILWQDSRVMARELLERDPTESAIPVAFGIPYDCRETDDSDSSNEIVWRLAVTAAVPGVDYEAQFDVPVFKTEASSPEFVLDEAALAGFIAESDPLRDLEASGVNVTPLPSGGVRLVFPAARNKGLAVGATIFLLIWAAIVVGTVKVGAPILFPIVLSGFGLLIAWFVLDLWFGSSRIEAKFQVLEFSGGLFGGKPHTLHFEEIDRIEPVQGMQSGNKLYYSVKATTTAGKSHTLAKRLDGLKLAETIVDVLNNALTSAK